MPELKRAAGRALALILVGLAGCSHSNDDDNASGPRTNIDLTVSSFTVSPDNSDPEDSLALSGTIQNIGSETANALQGDSFILRFNLSLDGTFEVNEQGFLEKIITDPIPPGGTLNFAHSAPFGGGDTQSFHGNFCTSFGCVPPETGVIGVLVDGADVIDELEEGNNFQFVTHEVVGTRVAASLATCDFGTTDPGGPGCNLIVSDGLYTTTPPIHRPCSPCQDGGVVLPNEIHRFVSVIIQLKGCTDNQVPNGFCGWGVTITGVTQKPGLPEGKKQTALSCNAFFGDGPNVACPFQVEIRDENY